MTSVGKSRTQLVSELDSLRRQLEELTKREAEWLCTERVLRRRNRELDLLHRFGQELAATLNLAQVSTQIMRRVSEIVGAEGASLWLWDEEKPGWLVCRAFFSQGPGLSLIDLRLAPGQGVAGWVAKTGQSMVIQDTSKEARFFPGVDEQSGFSTRSLLAVQLQARNATVGVLEVVNKIEGDFESADVALAEALAMSAATTLDNVRLMDALRTYATELEERNEELDAFAHTVAHDLQNPLSQIVGFAGLLEEDCQDMDGDELRTHLHSIAKAGHKMINITDELLLLASVRKMDDVPIEPLNMRFIVSEACMRLAHMIDDNNVQFVLPEQWPSASGYAPWVEEIWVNYISNGIKYGGRPPRLLLDANLQPDGMIRFWVQDNGAGLSAEEQSLLFSPFTRLGQARARGHGLGLSIVRRIVEKLGGTVNVSSAGQPGQGSVFSFTLPRYKGGRQEGR